MSQPQQHHLLAASPSSRSILLGTVTILLTTQQFVDGYQNGYLRFRLSGPSTRMTDYEVYTFLLTNLRDFHYPDRWNAGYVLGWITALLERPTQASERAFTCEVTGHDWQVGLLHGLLICGHCHEAVAACPLCHPGLAAQVLSIFCLEHQQLAPDDQPQQEGKQP